MKKVLLGIGLITLIWFAMATLVFAKAPADLITILPVGGQQKPIEISDSRVLAQFNPWTGDFFAPDQNILSQPPDTDRLYQVSFYLRDGSGGLRLNYAFQYADSAPAAIYLPGRGETGYTLNASTILRDGKDGHWLRASQGWVQLIQGALGNQAGPGTPPPPQWIFSHYAGVAVGAITLIGVFLFLQSRKRK